MRIMFVNALLGGDFSALDLGITALATYVNERSAHSATICDLTFHQRDWRRHITREIRRKQPDLIGISCNTMYMKYVRRVLDEMKRHHLPILLGGHHATLHPEECIGLDGVSAVIRGDGERPLVAYLNSLSREQESNGTPGLWIKSISGAVMKHPEARFEPEMDELPRPNYDLWDDLDSYFSFLRMLYVQGSRGCPYTCTFCDISALRETVKGPYFRMIGPKRYARDLSAYYEKYRNRGIKLFQLFDPVFTISTRWIHEFCQEYTRLGLHDHIGYSAFSRIDHLTEEKIRLLAGSGCKILRVGIETGDDHIRNAVYGKHVDTPKIRHIIDLAHKRGLKFTAYFILGGPYETRRSFRRTIRLAWELDAARSVFFMYKPLTEEGMRQIRASGGGIDGKRWEQADNITFGGVTRGTDWSRRTAELHQMAAYFLTFGRRWLRTVMRRKHRYFIEYVKYMVRGLARGLDFRYLAVYFHIYGDDNVDR